MQPPNPSSKSPTTSKSTEMTSSASNQEVSRSALSIDTSDHSIDANANDADAERNKLKKKSNSTNSMISSVHSSASSTSSNVRRIKKHNVVLENELDQNSPRKNTQITSYSPTLISPTRSLGGASSGGNFNAIIENSFEFNVDADELSNEPVKPILGASGSEGSSVAKEFNILTNPINYNQNKKEEKSAGEPESIVTETKSEESSGNESSTSPDKVEHDIYSSSVRSAGFKPASVSARSVNLIPLSPQSFKNRSVLQNTNSGDTISG